MTPRPESRISALEKRASALEATVEELSSDTAENFRDIKQDIKQLSDGMMASFKQIGDTFVAFGETMATKEDLSKLETRIDILSKDVTELKSTQAEQGAKLDQILALLQQRPDK